MADYVVVGAADMLGRAVTENLAARGSSFVALTRAEFDLTAPDGRLDLPPDTRVVINCAAYTNVDGAETEEALATNVNGHAVGRLAQACRAQGALLVHYSTDYVFEGNASSPYPVDAPRAPLNAYGRSKAVGEELLEQSGADYLLLRTSWVYAPWGKNFVLTMAKLQAEKPKLQVVDDQRGRPTSSLWLGEATLRLVATQARGTFHVTDGGECTWFGLAQTVGQLTGASCVLEPCTTAQFPRPAVRPAYSTLDLSKTEALLGQMPHFTDSVRESLALSTR